MTKYADFTDYKYSAHGLALSQITKDSRLILDLGCASGYLGKRLFNTHALYGVDVDAESLATASKWYTETAQIDFDITNELPWDIQFDIVLCLDILEHLNKPQHLLQQITNRYLKNEGRVIISLPNVANWTIRLKLMFGMFEYTETGILDKTHKHLFTYLTARKLVTESGLIVTKELGGSNYFGRLIDLMPSLRTLLAHNILLICKRAL